MWVLSKIRVLRPGLVAVMALFVTAPWAAAQSLDPVEDLRQALRESEDAPELRQETLRKKVEALTTLPQLRRALMLTEWLVDPVRASEKIRKVDVPLREKVATRLTALIRQVVKSGDNSAKLAVANLIAEMGPAVRSPVAGDFGGYTRTLTPEVLQLVVEKDLAVRQEALRALGNIFPKTADAIPVFRGVIENDTLGPRRLAADGLGQLVRVVSFLRNPGRDTTGVDAFSVDVLNTSNEVIGAAMTGLRDEDAQVRALCLIAVQVATQAIADQIPEPISPKKSPGKGPKGIVDDPRLLRGDMTDLAPVLLTIRSNVPALVQSLQDSNSLVKYSAIQALEGAGKVRLKMRRRFLAAPTLKDDKGDLKKDAETFVQEYDPLAPLLTKNLAAAAVLLREPETRLRRATLDFLEMLEEAAAPVLGELTTALSDPDRFVRWGAARVMYYLPSEKAALAVPHLARLLCDPDLRVRITVAQTLEGMGPLAKEAAPALAQAVGQGDVEARIPAMLVLQRLPPEIAQVAIPQLSDNLRHADPRLRKAAAETLGRLGSAARPAIPALRRALGDEDPEVRVHASDAILNISLDTK